MIKMVSKLLKLSFFALICVSLLSFVTLSSHVEASLPSVTARISSRFGNEPLGPAIEQSALTYGTRVSVTQPDPGVDPFTFAYWSVNGFLRPDLLESHQFLVNSRMEIEAIYRPNEEWAVVYLDSNGFILHFDFLLPGTEVPDPILATTITAPSREGLTVAALGARWEVVTGQGVGVNIADNSVLRLVYVNSSTLDITISGDAESLFNISMNTPVTGSEVPFNSVIRATAPEASTGEVFSHWLEDGVIVSFSEVFYFTALYDRNITAVYRDVDDPDMTAPMVTLSPRLNIEAGTYSYVGQVSLPSEYELIEYGFLLTDDLVSGLTFNSSTIAVSGTAIKFLGTPGSNTLSVPSESLQILTKEFVSSFVIGSHNAVRAYITYLDEENNVQTVLSNIELLAPLGVSQVWDRGFANNTPVHISGIVAAFTDVGFILQDVTTGQLISIHDSANTMTSASLIRGDLVELEGNFSISFSIQRVNNVSDVVVLAQNQNINFSTENAIDIDFNNFSRSDYQGKLIRVTSPWGRLSSLGDTGYVRLGNTQLGVESQIYGGSYFGILNGTIVNNLTESLLDLFPGGANTVRYSPYVVYVFMFDSSGSYSKTLIIGDDHIIIDDTAQYDVILSSQEIDAITTLSSIGPFDFREEITIDVNEPSDKTFIHWFDLDLEVIFSTTKNLTFNVDRQLNLEARFSTDNIALLIDFGSVSVTGYDTTTFTFTNNWDSNIYTLDKQRAQINSFNDNQAAILGPISTSPQTRLAFVEFDLTTVTGTFIRIDFDIAAWSSTALTNLNNSNRAASIGLEIFDQEEELWIRLQDSNENTNLLSLLSTTYQTISFTVSQKGLYRIVVDTSSGTYTNTSNTNQAVAIDNFTVIVE